MNTPPKGHVWLHVNKFDDAKGRAWAVQYHGPRGGKRYAAVTAVRVWAQGYTQFCGEFGDQPRAYLVFPDAHVKISGGVATIY